MLMTKRSEREIIVRYIIDCPKDIHEKVVDLIAKGRYSSMQDFAITAFQNQMVIENSDLGLQRDNKHTIQRDSQLSPQELGDGKIDYSVNQINPDIITHVEINKSKGSDHWLFGQINRVLPIKFGLRMLLIMLQEKGQWLPLEYFHEKAAKNARSFGDKLEEIDEHKQNKRSEKLSVGFPIGSISKSLDRYKSQFLGYVKPTSGIYVGALPILNFAEIIKNKDDKYSIGITKPGKSFGMLQNTFIDKLDGLESITEQEATFYIEHIIESVPSESSAVNIILDLINSGINSPKQIDEKIGAMFPEWTDNQVTTNRSGVLGRVWDMGLINKERDGLRVSYSLSKFGLRMLKKF
jgi:hypothetical protein